MRISIVFLICPFIICFSCIGQEVNLEDELKECVNVRINNPVYKINDSLTINYYKFISEIQDLFINEKFLFNDDKQAYIILINDIFNNKDATRELLLNKIAKIKKDNNLNELYLTKEVLEFCPHFLLSNNELLIKSMDNQFESMDKLIAFGPFDKKLVKQLVQTVEENDFKSIVYKAPVIAILLDYIESN